MADPRKGLPSCSELGRLMACPGSFFARKNWKHAKDTPNPIRESGTKVEEVIECEIDGAPHSFTLTEAERWIVDKCIEMKDRINAELFGEVAAITHRFTKERMWLTDNGEALMSGEADVIECDAKGSWLIVDNKRGYRPVPVATRNWQLTGYILCLIENHPKLEGSVPDLTRVFGAILQPLISLNPVKVEIGSEQAMQLRRQVVNQLRLAMFTDDQPRYPGPHCYYCPVSHVCPEASSTVAVWAKPLDVVRSLTDAQLADMKPKMEMAARFIEQFNSYFKERVAVKAVPGYEIKTRKSGFEISDPMEVFQAAKGLTSPPLIDAAAFRTVLDVSMPALKKLWCGLYAEKYRTTKVEGERIWEAEVEAKFPRKPPVTYAGPIPAIDT